MKSTRILIFLLCMLLLSSVSACAADPAKLTTGYLPYEVRVVKVNGYELPVREGSLGITIPCVVGRSNIRDNRPLDEADRQSLKVYFPLLTDEEMSSMTKSDMQERLDAVELTTAEKNSLAQEFPGTDLTGRTWADVKRLRQQNKLLPNNAVTAMGVTPWDYTDLSMSLKEANLSDDEMAAMGEDALRQKLEELYLSRIEYLMRFTYGMSAEEAQAFCEQLQK